MALVKFKNDYNRAFDSVFAPLFSDVFENVMNTPFTNTLPSVNIVEDKGTFKIELAAPGLAKEDFKIALEKNILTISAEKKSENKEEEKGKFVRKEYSYSSFKRSFSLPDNIKAEGIKAEYQDGVLKLSIQKNEASDETREIHIS